MIAKKASSVFFRFSYPFGAKTKAQFAVLSVSIVVITCLSHHLRSNMADELVMLTRVKHEFPNYKPIVKLFWSAKEFLTLSHPLWTNETRGVLSDQSAITVACGSAWTEDEQSKDFSAFFSPFTPLVIKNKNQTARLEELVRFVQSYPKSHVVVVSSYAVFTQMQEKMKDYLSNREVMTFGYKPPTTKTISEESTIPLGDIKWLKATRSDDYFVEIPYVQVQSRLGNTIVISNIPYPKYYTIVDHSNKYLKLLIRVEAPRTRSYYLPSVEDKVKIEGFDHKTFNQLVEYACSEHGVVYASMGCIALNPLVAALKHLKNLQQ